MEAITVSSPTLLAIKGLTVEQKQALASELNVSINTLYRWVKNNDENLTKAGVVRKIADATGLPIEVIIPNQM